MNNIRTKIGILIVVIVIIIAAIATINKDSTPATQTYTESDYNFKVTFPTSWVYEDQLTPQHCCLFVAYWTYATTTEMGTTTTSTTTPIPIEKVTAREWIKLQIGGYDKKVLDPFKAATTSIVRLGNQNWYVGTSGAMTFYLLPRTDTTGIGVAQFIYKETTPEQIEEAKKIISTLQLLPEPTSTSTATTTAK